MANNFRAVGTLNISQEEKEFAPTYDKNGIRSYALRFRVKDNVHSSSVRCNIIGSETDVLNLAMEGGTQGEKVAIMWKDRLDPSKIRTVARFMRYRFAYDEDGVKTYKEFITSYDMVMFMKKMLPKYNGKRIAVDGNYKRSLAPNGDTVYDNFDIKNVTVLNEEESEKYDDNIAVSVELYYNNESLMPTETENLYKLFCYTNEWIKEEREMKLVHCSAILDLTEMYNAINNESDEARKKQIESAIKLRLGFTQSDLPEDGTYVKLRWECFRKLGADQDEVKFEDLTEMQKTMVESGDSTIDDFRGMSTIKDELRLIKPVIKGEYKNGFVSTSITKESLSRFVYEGNGAEMEADKEAIKGNTEAVTSEIDALLYGKK